MLLLKGVLDNNCELVALPDATPDISLLSAFSRSVKGSLGLLGLLGDAPFFLYQLVALILYLSPAITFNTILAPTLAPLPLSCCI